MVEEDEVSVDDVLRFLRLLFKDGDCFEVRILQASDRPGGSFKATMSGYYNDIDKAAEHIAKIDDEKLAPAIYVTLNPVERSLLARSNNDMVFRAKESTPDQHILRRRALLIDFDPDRPSGISSTNQEHEDAIALARKVQGELSSFGWPEPMVGSSGNGAHLLYRIDLDPESDLPRRVLDGLASKYSTDKVKIDTGVHNPARITKVLGTMARKGDELLDVPVEEVRPHRRSKIIDAPEKLECVTPECLEHAASFSKTESRGDTSDSDSGVFQAAVARMRSALEEYGAEIKRSFSKGNTTYLCLEECVVDSEIKSTGDSDIAVIVGENGRYGYKNLHDRGKDYSIRDVKKKIDPQGEKLKKSTDSNEKPKVSQVDALVDIGRLADLFHSMDSTDPQAYVAYDDNGTIKTCLVRSGQFRLWIQNTYYCTCKKSANKDAIASALATLESIAVYEGDRRAIANRIHEDGETVCIDLGCDAWKAVQITAQGWKIVPHPELPFHFIRSQGMEAMPIPVRGGSVDDLRPYLNLSSDTDWKLVIGFILMSLSGRGPFPILAVTGEQGSAKSTLCRVVRSFVDPNKSELRSLPGNERDLVISSLNSWLQAFDNLSGIKPNMADALCRLSTGSGFSTRKLYEDTEETIIQVQRPVVLNGIEDLATRPDLADRALFVHLPRILSSERRDERTFWRDFNEVQPKIFGALFDVLAGAIAQRDRIRLSRMPRMADFALFVVAAAPSLGWDPEEFLSLYESGRMESAQDAVESSVIGPVLITMLEKEKQWEGTAQELLKELRKQVFHGDRVWQNQRWPQSPKGMGNALRRIAPALTSLGYTVDSHRESGGNRRRLFMLAVPGGGATGGTVGTIGTVPDRSSTRTAS